MGFVPGSSSPSAFPVKAILSLPSSAFSLFSTSAISLVQRILLTGLFLLLFNTEGGGYHRRNDVSTNGGHRTSGFILMVNGDDAAKAKVQEDFIADLKWLLTHSQRFYNKYGNEDAAVDDAFEEAKIAANYIFVLKEVFTERMQKLNRKIREAVGKKEETAVTADGVPVHFVDKYVLLLGTVGGMGGFGRIRFPD